MPPKTTKKAVPAVSLSPPSILKRKTNVTPYVGQGVVTNNRPDTVTSSNTAVENFDVHWITKYQGALSQRPPEAAFIHPMKVEYENKKVIGDLNVVKAIMYRRDPSKDGQFHLIGKNGTAYRWDCLITERSTDTDDAASIGKRIAAAFTEFGKDRTDDGTVDPSPQKQNEFKWKQPPVFVFQKDVSSDPPKPMNYFLCDVDCIKLLKLQYSEDNAKEDVMADDGIMTAYFASPEEGHRVLQNITEAVWRCPM